MISAWGVDHGEISKAYKKIAGRLARSGTQVARPTDTLQQRQLVNYRQWRTKSGALQSQVNPNRWRTEDAKNLREYGIGPPDERTLAVRAKGEASTAEKARNLKLGAQAMVTGHANAGKKKRVLP